MQTQAKKRELFLGYTAIIYAMYLFFILWNNFSGRTQEHWRFFYAFTQQSNILAGIWLLFFGISAFAGKPFYHMARNKTVMTAVTVYMSITFFIVLFVLDPVYQGKWMPFKSASEFITHNATTLVMWIYFFLVQGEGKPKAAHCLYVLIYPFLYVLANLLIGANVRYADGNAAYAYGFINPNSYGNIGIFVGVVVGLILIFALFGLALMKMKEAVNRVYFAPEEDA